MQSTPLDLTVKAKNKNESQYKATVRSVDLHCSSNAGRESHKKQNFEPAEAASDRQKEIDAPENSNPCCSLSVLHRSSSNFHDDSCRRHRTAFSRTQTNRLESEFQKDNYLSRSKRMDLAKELNLYENTIKVYGGIRFFS